MLSVAIFNSYAESRGAEMIFIQTKKHFFDRNKKNLLNDCVHYFLPLNDLSYSVASSLKRFNPLYKSSYDNRIIII
jgi:hypothetical protein